MSKLISKPFSQSSFTQSNLTQSQEQKQPLAWRAYLELTKPKVVALMLLTVWVGMCLASPQFPEPSIMLWGLLGIGLLSGSAAACNHVIDEQIDKKMIRTHQRPLAQGVLTAKQATSFAGIIGLLGFALLYWQVNPLTAWLTFGCLIGYALIYTRFLKRATPQNIVIGGLAGAMPPLLGWTAVTGEFHGHGLLLVMIIFTWTPPHFWALAIHRKEDYAKANIPMLPVTHGIDFTKTCIVLYSLLLALVCLLPVILGMSGLIYFVGTMLLNLRFLMLALQLKVSADPKLPMQLFKFSILYLMLLFVLLLTDHYFTLF